MSGSRDPVAPWTVYEPRRDRGSLSSESLRPLTAQGAVRPQAPSGGQRTRFLRTKDVRIVPRTLKVIMKDFGQGHTGRTLRTEEERLQGSPTRDRGSVRGPTLRLSPKKSNTLFSYQDRAALSLWFFRAPPTRSGNNPGRVSGLVRYVPGRRGRVDQWFPMTTAGEGSDRYDQPER